MNEILCSDRNHPIWPKLKEFADASGMHLESRQEDLRGNGYLFLVSCTELIGKAVRDSYKHVLVLHESDLPKGRGWSPVAWQIIEGKDEITVSLLEAAANVDSGDVWFKEEVYIPRDALADEISARVWEVKKKLILRALDGASPRKQMGEPSYYRRRTPQDSRLDPDKTIAEQFDLLRICEPRFPAFFEHRGAKYQVSLRRV